MTRMTRLLGFVFAAVLALAVPAQAQLAEVSASGTIDAAGDSVVLAIRGRSYVAARATNGTTFSGILQVEVSSDGGTTWDERIFINGDNMVAGDFLPHAVEPIREYSIPLNPTNTHVRVKPLTYTSGSTVVTLRANDQMDAAYQSGAFGFQSVPTTLDGVNDAIEVGVGGGSGVGFFIDAGTFAGTLVVESSPYSHGNTTWSAGVFFANNDWVTSLVLTNPNSALPINVPPQAGAQRVRLRVSAYTSGTMLGHGRAGRVHDVIGNAVSAALNGFAAPPFGVQQGAQARSTEPAVVTAGDLAFAMADLVGKQVTLPYAAPGDLVRGYLSKATTAEADLIAAQGAGVRVYLTNCVFNNGGTINTITLSDGAGSPQVVNILGVNTSVAVTFPAPLRPASANTAWRISLSGATQVHVTCSGYKSAA